MEDRLSVPADPCSIKLITATAAKHLAYRNPYQLSLHGMGVSFTDLLSPYILSGAVPTCYSYLGSRDQIVTHPLTE